jgi:hypothetical protein
MRSSPTLTKTAQTRLLAGLLILSGVRGSFARWFFPRLLSGVVLLMAKIRRRDEG